MWYQNCFYLLLVLLLLFLKHYKNLYSWILLENSFFLSSLCQFRLWQTFTDCIRKKKKELNTDHSWSQHLWFFKSLVLFLLFHFVCLGTFKKYMYIYIWDICNQHVLNNRYNFIHPFHSGLKVHSLTMQFHLIERKVLFFKYYFLLFLGYL